MSTQATTPPKYPENFKFSEGLYEGVPIEVYHSDCCPGPSVSSSILRNAKRYSLAYAQYYSHFNKRYTRNFEQTDAQRLGDAAHTLLLGDEPFNRRFIKYPFQKGYNAHDAPPGVGGIYKRDDKKAWRDEMVAAGKSILNEVEVNILKGMTNAVKRDQREWIDSGMFEGRNEVSGFYQDKETELWIKIRPDNVPTNQILGDYKTIAEVSDYHIRKSITEYRYDMQMALGNEGLRYLDGFDIEHALLMFQETKPPYIARIFELSEDWIAHAAVENRAQLRRIARAIDQYGFDRMWPGPGAPFVKAATPDWIAKDVQDGQSNDPDLYPSFGAVGFGTKN